VKFHAVYWPIMLKAMGLPLPKQILVHGWWQKDGAKNQQEHRQHR
jgi:methionyl-tRNA synthetase